ncbi:MAG: sigma 54-interacting transcriptional regulator [Planctomycetaceae bacterium]|nr:sigma 54-interacting transcriptional regulator [Planctomycetaceae bacterium]
MTSGTISPDVRPLIAESWLRSRGYGVDCHNASPQILSPRELQERLDDNREFLDFSSSTLQKINLLARDGDHLLSLHDREGYLLEYVVRHPDHKRRPNSKYVLGAKWDEASVGTNGVGIVLATNLPVQVVGAEHYCADQHAVTCSAAPIHDRAGTILGVLNMSGSYAMSDTRILGLIEAGAFAIESQLALSHSQGVISNTLEAISECLIILDEQLRIVTASRYASTLFGIQREALKERRIEEFFRPSDFKEKVFIGKKPFSYLESTFRIDGRTMSFNVSVTPILSRRKVTGVILLLRESRIINRMANIVAGNSARYNFSDIVTRDSKMLGIIGTMKEIAPTDCTVLLEGESGTGKELFAHSIHTHSERRNGPFVTINCASLPRGLVESELFGYEKGAFTGALGQGNPGKFELADGGTIFLDEVGELPQEIQAKLLRVLDTHRVSRIGGKTEKTLDVRVIAATNRDLQKEVAESHFRRDLYYRINVLKFTIPPLRERVADVSLLAESFLENLNRHAAGNQGSARHKRFSAAFLQCLQRASWPGNVRELQNTVVRAFYASADREELTPGDLPENFSCSEDSREDVSSDCDAVASDTSLRHPEPPSLQEMEKAMILAAVKSRAGDVVRAGQSLGMSKATIYRKIKKHAIDIRLFKS